MISAPLEAARAGELETFYVSTVFESAPLDRVWAHGFAMRGKASIGVDANGIERRLDQRCQAVGGAAGVRNHRVA